MDTIQCKVTPQVFALKVLLKNEKDDLNQGAGLNGPSYKTTLSSPILYQIAPAQQSNV
jgi:hypothetical protein